MISDGDPMAENIFSVKQGESAENSYEVQRR